MGNVDSSRGRMNVNVQRETTNYISCSRINKAAKLATQQSFPSNVTSGSRRWRLQGGGWSNPSWGGGHPRYNATYRSRDGYYMFHVIAFTGF